MPSHSFKESAGAMQQRTQRTSVTYDAVACSSGATIGVYTTSPVTLVSSTAFDVGMIRLWTTTNLSNNGLRTDYAADLMIGAASSETPIISAMLFGGKLAYASYTIPVYIPAGSRISIRTASGVASRSCSFNIDLLRTQDPSSSPSRWVAYGTNISSGVGAYGTSITYGTSGVFGSWTSLTTSTTYAHDLWLPVIGSGVSTAFNSSNHRTQVAIASTADAATMVTNSTGVFDAPWSTTSTSEVLGGWAGSTNGVFHIGVDSIIYAPRGSGASISARGASSGTGQAGVNTVAMLGAVK